MKKLMMTAVFAGLAIASQAATIKWSQTAIKDNDGNLIDDSSVTMYTFTLDKTAYQYMVTYAANNSIADAGKYLYDNLNTTTPSLKINGTTYSAWGNVKTSNEDGLVASDTVPSSQGTEYYAATIFIHNEGDDDEEFKGNVGFFNQTGTKSQNTGKMAEVWLGGTNGSSALGDWQTTAVPEPFSASLCLLGMGAIALRRKMKKAKKA